MLPQTAPPLEIERPTIFPPHVLAGVTLRNAHLFPRTGLSLTKAQMLNDEELLAHRSALAAALHRPLEHLRFQKQVHGTHVRRVDATSTEEESDGLITNATDVVLCAGMADCAAILLYDPAHEAVAALHSGWGGTKANIVAQGIAQMHRAFATDPRELLAYISPAASGARYVVRWDVAQHFPASVLQPLNDHQWLFDNRARVVEQLQECGVKSANIEVSEGCTIADERYHSHRRDGAHAGRMAAFIGLMHSASQ
jgi:YfiH family protein